MTEKIDNFEKHRGLGKTLLLSYNGNEGSEEYMFNGIVNKIVSVLKSQETKEFVNSSTEDIIKAFAFQDAESIVKSGVGTIDYVVSIKDILFWNKVKIWLSNIYDNPDMEVKISSKFAEDNDKYVDYTKRQLQYITEIDEDEKIDYYANLTRAWLIGYIDSSIYFKLVYLLKIFTLEELKYLRDDYNEVEFTTTNFYIKEYERHGIVEIVQETDQGNTVYRYSHLAKVFLVVGLRYGEMNIGFEKLGLADLEVINTRVGHELLEL